MWKWARLPLLREDEQLCLCMKMHRQWRGCAVGSAWVFQHRRGENGVSVGVMVVVCLPSWGQPCWWSVRVGKYWQSCHTPLLAITTPTNSRTFNGGGWMRQGRMTNQTGWWHMDFSPMAQGLTSPTLILMIIIPLLNLVVANVAGWVN